MHGTGILLRIVHVWYKSAELENYFAIPLRFCQQRSDSYKLIIYTLKSLPVEHFYTNNLLAAVINIVMLFQKTVQKSHWKKQNIWKYLTEELFFLISVNGPYANPTLSPISTNLSIHKTQNERESLSPKDFKEKWWGFFIVLVFFSLPLSLVTEKAFVFFFCS